MALHRSLLLLLPLQAWLMATPSVLAHPSDTPFLPNGYRGSVCKALLPHCMTASQWARVCRNRYPSRPLSEMPQSCRDALGFQHHQPHPPTRFLPESHRGPSCLALLPGCMTRSQWARVCEGHRHKDPNYVYPLSCRDALGLPHHRERQDLRRGWAPHSFGLSASV